MVFMKAKLGYRLTPRVFGLSKQWEMGWWGAQEKEREGVSYNDFIAPDSEYYDD